MAAGTYKILPENPNDVTGGGGCLCNEAQCPDTEGPFVVFYATEMESVLSPSPVLCARCAVGAVEALEDYVQDNEPDLEV